MLADGRRIRTGSRVAKSSAGYDLLGLFIGSEGTLGVITGLTLRLRGIPEHTIAVRATFPSVDAACVTSSAIVGMGLLVSRLELLDDLTIHFINAFKGTAFPELPTLFIEVSGGAGVEEELEVVLALCAEQGSTTFEVERDPTKRARLWEARHDAAHAVIAAARPEEAQGHRRLRARVPASRRDSRCARGARTPRDRSRPSTATSATGTTTWR